MFNHSLSLSSKICSKRNLKYTNLVHLFLAKVKMLKIYGNKIEVEIKIINSTNPHISFERKAESIKALNKTVTYIIINGCILCMLSFYDIKIY